MKFGRSIGKSMFALGAALACAGAAEAATNTKVLTIEPHVGWQSKTIGLPTIDPSIKYGPRRGYYIGLRTEPTRNQRKRRKQARRRHSAGFKNAFAY
jgi:hypothetical protein